MLDFMAIDPGTYKTGAAVFRGENLIDAVLCEVPRSMEFEDRISGLLVQLDSIVARYRYVRQVVCEKATAIEGVRPAPELQAFIRRLRRWATSGSLATPHKFSWLIYHPSTVLASVRLRGMRRQGSVTTKTLIATGVVGLYGSYLEDQDQNVLDAVAVGHCHVTKMWLDETIGGR